MKKVFKGMAVVVAALGLVATVGLTALAQQGPGQGRQAPPWGHGPWGGGPQARAFGLGFALGQLDLTAAQQEQVHAIMQQHQAEFQTLAAQARSARLALDQAAEAPTVDEAAIKAAAANMADVHAQMALTRARVRTEVMQVLTPEQREKAEQLKAQMQERMKTRGPRGPRGVPPPQ